MSDELVGLSDYRRVWRVRRSGRVWRIESSSVSVEDGGDRPRRRVGSSRGVVWAFSDRSRRRLMLSVNRLPEGEYLLVTLTLPGEALSADDLREAFRAFRMRLYRRFPAAVGLWKLEFQRRGAGHYHLMLLESSVMRAPLFEAWAKSAWYEVVGSGDSRHLKRGVDVQRLRKIGAYLASYLKKEGGVKAYQDSAPEGFYGRRWGVVGLRWSSPAHLRRLHFSELVRVLSTMDDEGWLAWSPRTLVRCGVAADTWLVRAGPESVSVA